MPSYVATLDDNYRDGIILIYNLSFVHCLGVCNPCIYICAKFARMI